MNDGETWMLPPAPQRHPEIFRLIDDVRTTLCDWIDFGEREDPKDPLGYVDFAFTNRTWNKFKAIAALLEKDFWEDSLILIRSLFELLLNLEQIHHGRHEPNAQATRFLEYEKLQEYLGHKATYDFCVHTGRIKPSPEQPAQAHASADGRFKRFRFRDGRGKMRWATSWCGLSVAELSRHSKNDLRTWQYKTLYAQQSAFVHASPLSILSTLTTISPDWQQQHLKREEINLRDAATLCVAFTLEILELAKLSIPKFNPSQVITFQQRLGQLNGRVMRMSSPASRVDPPGPAS